MSYVDPSPLVECIKALVAENEKLRAEIESTKKTKTLEDPSGYCCESMKQQLTYECDQHPDLTCPDIIITRSTTFRPIGLVEYTVSPHYTLWGRNAEYFCEFCPWCGADLGYQAYKKDVEALFDKEDEDCLLQNGKQDPPLEVG